MSRIHWTFRDRRTGRKITVDGPTSHPEREQLRMIIHNLRDQGRI